MSLGDGAPAMGAPSPQTPTLLNACVANNACSLAGGVLDSTDVSARLSVTPRRSRMAWDSRHDEVVGRHGT